MPEYDKLKMAVDELRDAIGRGKVKFEPVELTSKTAQYLLSWIEEECDSDELEDEEDD